MAAQFFNKNGTKNRTKYTQNGAKYHTNCKKYTKMSQNTQKIAPTKLLSEDSSPLLHSSITNNQGCSRNSSSFYLRQPFPLCHYKDPKGTDSDVYRLGIWDTCLSGFMYPYYWVCPQWFPPEKSVPVSQAASVSPLQEVLPISPPVPSPGQGWIPAVRLSFPTNLNSSQKLIVIVSTK